MIFRRGQKRQLSALGKRETRDTIQIIKDDDGIYKVKAVEWFTKRPNKHAAYTRFSRTVRQLFSGVIGARKRTYKHNNHEVASLSSAFAECAEFAPGTVAEGAEFAAGAIPEGAPPVAAVAVAAVAAAAVAAAPAAAVAAAAVAAGAVLCFRLR